MKFHYDKDGKYVGMSNCGIEPEGSSGSTDVPWNHAGQVFNERSNRWESTKDAPFAICKGTTKTGKQCRHKANHGDYCRQHVPA